LPGCSNMADINQSHQQVIDQQNADTIIHKYGIQPEYLVKLSGELGITNTALRNFFNIIEHERVPIDELDHTLREIAKSYQNLISQVNSLNSTEPEIQELQEKAKQHLKLLEFTEAEALLKKAIELDTEAEKAIEDRLNQRRISAASSLFTLGHSKLTQIKYKEAADYFKQALKKLPHNHEQRSVYLNQCGSLSHDLGEYDKAIEYYELALESDLKTFGPDHPNVAMRRNNIGGAWDSKGEYDKAIEYYELALASNLKTFGPDHLYIETTSEGRGTARASTTRPSNTMNWP